MAQDHANLGENLRNMRSARGLSLAEFSRELDIPKTTLQSILDHGQTSLYTTLHISHKLGIPLDTLTNGVLSGQQFRRLDGFLESLKWFDRLTKKKQEEVCHHVLSLILLMQEDHDE